MISSVKLPKLIAIENSRLATLHHVVTLSTFVSLVCYKFIWGHEQYTQIPINVRFALRWDEADTIQGMEDFFKNNALVEQFCHQAPYTNYSDTQRWGVNWTQRLSCASMCTLESVIDHSTWDSVWNGDSVPTSTEIAGGNCWASFQSFGLGQSYTALQFLASYGEQDAILTTSKNDWIVDHKLRTNAEMVETVPQGTAAVLDVHYQYNFAVEPPSFPFASQNGLTDLHGSNADAKTIILDRSLNPVRSYEPGEPIKFTVTDVMQWAHGYTSPELIQPELVSGAQYNLVLNCFGAKVDVENHFGRGTLPDYGPTLFDPVCFIEPIAVSGNYQVSVHYEIPQSPERSVEVVSEAKGIYFKCMNGGGSASVLDGSTMLLSITSMLVILALPTRFTSIVAARMLGPLSEMYRRSIVESYDIERATAAAATVLAANMATFHQLSTPNHTGKSLLHQAEIKKVMDAANVHKGVDLEEVEVASLARFVFDGLHAKGKKDSVLTEFCPCDHTRKEKDETPVTLTESTDGISLDEWNEARMEGEKVTFDAFVKLFDKDRHRSFLEKFFTPPGIKAALARAARVAAAAQQSTVEKPSRVLQDALHGSREDRAMDQASSAEETLGSDRIMLDPSTAHGPHGEPSKEEVLPRSEMRLELARLTARLEAAEQRLCPMEETLGKALPSEVAEKAVLYARERSLSTGPLERRLEHLESRVDRGAGTKFWATAILKSLGPLADAEEEESSAPRPQTRGRRSSPEDPPRAGRHSSGSSRPSARV